MQNLVIIVKRRFHEFGKGTFDSKYFFFKDPEDTIVVSHGVNANGEFLMYQMDEAEPDELEEPEEDEQFKTGQIMFKYIIVSK